MQRVFYSLRSRLILLVALTFIPAIILLIQIGYIQRDQAVAAARREVAHLANMATNTQELIGNNVEAFLLMLAHNPALRQNDVTGCQDVYSHLVLEHFDYYSSFYVADLEGNIVCNPSGMHVPLDFHECDHYQTLIQADDFVTSGYHICNQTGKAVLSIGYPIYNLQNERILVTNVSVDLAWFYDFAAKADLPKGSELVMVDDKGIILSHYPDNDLWRGNPIPETSILRQLNLKKEGSLIGAGLDGSEVIAAINPIGGSMNRVHVIYSLPTRIAFAEANKIIERFLLSLLFVLVGVVFLTWKLGDALILKQVGKIIQATHLLEKGDLTVRTGIDYSHSELGELAQSFDSMAEQLAIRETERDLQEKRLQEYAQNLEHSNKELKEFAFISSHDLQEPLRKIQIFGELLAERNTGSLDPNGMDYIQRMRDAAERMQQLLISMLAFSRITNHTSPFVKVDLNQVLQQVLADLDWQIERNKAVIQVSDLPEITADPVLLNQLFANLVSNAIKFHKKDCPPVIRIFSPKADNESNIEHMCTICVEDEGIGFDEKYLDRIFQPFQRLHARGEFEGTGIGLAICRRIVNQHGGTITARSQPGVGSTFSVHLPYNQSNERQG